MDNTYYLHLSGMSDEKQVHKSLQTLLALPHYYGNNLDALYDVMSERSEKVRLIIAGIQNTPARLCTLVSGVEEVMKDTGNRVLRVD